MGGPGSGNHYHWWRSSKKTVVEECLKLDVSRLKRQGCLIANACSCGSWNWKYHSGHHFDISFEANLIDPTAPYVRLFYTWVWRSTQQQESADYRVRLVTTCPQFRVYAGGSSVR